MVVSLFVGLVVLIVAAGVGLWYVDNNADDAGSSSSAGGTGTTGSTDGDGGVAADDNGSSELPPGLGYSGYDDYSTASCDGSETWVYAGEGGGSAAVVCVSDASGELYLRGDLAGGPVSGDVDMNTPVDVRQGIYSVPVSDGTVEVGGDRIMLDTGDDFETIAEFEDVWIDSQVTDY